MKNKPSGTSGREYLEALVCKLKSQDESWKEKAQGLQQEVLRLRQELLITRMTSNTKSTTEAAGHDATMDDTSQDLFGPGSETCSIDLQSDSETPELQHQDPQPAITSPQPSVTSGCYRSLRGKAMPRHVELLQSLCTLHRVKGNNRGLESLWFSPDGSAGSLLVDSVCQLLDSVVAACRDPSPLEPSDVVLQACQVAAQAMDLFCSQRLPSVEFMGRVEECLRELTGLLLHSNQLSRLQAAEKLMEYLITLGSSSMSKSFLIRHILSQISTLADQLWQAFQGERKPITHLRRETNDDDIARVFFLLYSFVKSTGQAGAGELRARPVSHGPASELVLPVLDPGGAPAEVRGTMQGGGGVGADGPPQSLGAARLSTVR
ncbi:hypothetical protein ABVT39_017655 [Epinephelus coioides]